MKKFFINALCVCLLFCGILTGCTLDNNNDEGSPVFSFIMNFYQEEFEEEYSHYESELIVEKDSKEIDIDGNTSSGKIDVKLICKNGDSERTYLYEVNGILDEKIILEEGVSGNWTALLDCYENTEGSIEISVR